MHYLLTRIPLPNVRCQLYILTKVLNRRYQRHNSTDIPAKRNHTLVVNHFPLAHTCPTVTCTLLFLTHIMFRVNVHLSHGPHQFYNRHTKGYQSSKRTHTKSIASSPFWPNPTFSSQDATLRLLTEEHHHPSLQLHGLITLRKNMLPTNDHITK